MTVLFWFTGLIFAALLPWGTNVPLHKRGILVKVVVIANIVVHLVTAGFIFESNVSPWASVETREHAVKAATRYETYRDTVALTPSKLREEGGWRWGQLITANFIHVGWLHLALNLWLFALYGQNLEELFGRRRFAVFLVAAMVGSQLAIIWLTELTNAYRVPHGGFSGVVYAVIGAYLVCFPRSQVKVALVYDFRFWACIGFLLVPAVYIFGMSSPSLGELILLIGVVGLFVFLEPEHARFGLPAIVLLGYKLFQDAITMPQQAEDRISIWGHMGGLVVGIVVGFVVNGTKGFHQTWEDPDAALSPRRKEREKVNVAKMEAAARDDEDAARVYLGQRIFVGDVVRATEFYLQTALKKFPDLRLDPRELHSLGRMLELKGHEAAALRVYEQLIQVTPIPPGYEDAFLTAAKLCHQTAPERAVDALRYLKLFEANAQMMRDRHEARRQREEILVAARARGEDCDALLAAAEPDGGSHKPGSVAASTLYGGPGQPERRKTSRSTSRIQQIDSGDKYPPVASTAPDQSGRVAPAKPPELRGDLEEPRIEERADASQSRDSFWGKKRLAMKTTRDDPPARRHQDSSTSILPAHTIQNPGEVPDIPRSVEQRAGLKRPRVELSGMDLEPLEPPAQPAPVPARETLRQLRSKGLDYGYSSPVDTEPETGVERKSEDGGSGVMSEDDKHVIVPSLRESAKTETESSQREGSLKPGAEYALPGGGSHTSSPELSTAHRVYSSDKLSTPSPDAAMQSGGSGIWVVLQENVSGQFLPQDSEQVDRLLSILSQELCTPVTAESISNSAGVLQATEDLDVELLESKLRVAGAGVLIVHEMPAALTRDPVEALSVDVLETDLVCNTVEAGRIRVPFAAVLAMQQSAVRLSRRESAQARLVIEIVAGENIGRRIQLHERTFSLHNSKQSGEPLPVDSFEALAAYLGEKIGSEKFAREDAEIPYTEHDALVKRRCMIATKVG
ncbi:MAG: rhomboid family intramembrane serine protease [Candidatus Sumerlaeaceae bacterium]